MTPKAKPQLSSNGIGLDLVPLSNAYWVPVDQIEPNPFQPRERFDQEEMRELAAHIKEHGVQQPILLRPIKGKTHRGIRYQIVYGERRWRASQMAGKVQLPAIVRELTDLQAREIAYDENVLRESLTDYEEAKGLMELWNAYEANGENVSQNQMARRRKVSVTFVSNRVKLLDLDEELLEIAKRERGVMSSLFLIGSVTNRELKEQLKEMLLKGASFRKIQTTKEQWDAEQARIKESYRAPDAHTQQRSALHSQTGGGNVSRGRVVTGNSKREAKREVEEGLKRAEEGLRHARAWAAAGLVQSRRLENIKRLAQEIEQATG